MTSSRGKGRSRKRGEEQGCQIFLGPNIQTWENIPKWPQTVPNRHKLYQMAVKYAKLAYNIPTFSFPKPSKIDPNCDFWFENKPSRSPGAEDGS
jgi:hypothetical protein